MPQLPPIKVDQFRVDCRGCELTGTSLMTIPTPVHSIFVEEISCVLIRLLAGAKHEAGAEGATAPEPLRQKDRKLMALWKAALGPKALVPRLKGSPKG